MSEKNKPAPKQQPPQPKTRNYSEQGGTGKLNEGRLPTSSLNPPVPKPKVIDGEKKNR